MFLMTWNAHIPARKRWGQNFISDPGTLNKLVRTIQPEPQDVMVEIGPGTGALTRLIAPRVKRLHAIEIDARMAETLDPLADEFTSFGWETGDFLEWEPDPALGRFRLLGNIPYYITSPLVLRAFELRKTISDVHFLMQKEVARRITAAPGSRQYGILSVYAALFSQADYLFDVSRNVFHPRPDVDSGFIRFTFDPDKNVELKIEPLLRQTVRTAFNQRRKTLRNSLKALLENNREFVEQNFDLDLRPEQVSPDEFLVLTKLIFK